ncbi:MAG TPA: ankyrin repeat domain-containing protein [Bryobacteraceae bacterium]|nr:ankyrin repeat domain-containing protein [Bryobacteraceae bacterium]
MKFVLALAAAGALFGASLDTRLVDAEKKADKAVVQDLLANHVDVNAPQPDGATALHWAAYWDDVETAKALLAAGADPNAKNRYGVTPLSLACTNGSAPMVDLLLNAKADVNLALPGGETPLMTAARTGKTDAVKLLLTHGADINAKDTDHLQTALMWAADEGNVSAVELLHEFGADLHAVSKGGFTALLFATREGRKDVVSTLLKEGASPNETIQKPGKQAGTSAMVLAVSNAHYELAAMLLDAGADPNAAEQGWTALHAITWVRQPGYASNDPAPEGSGNMTSIEFVKKIAAKGANLNAKMTIRTSVGLSSLNTSGATPFLLAARTGDAELMRLLAKLGADPLMPNVDGTTPLMVAAGVGTRSPGEDAGTNEEVLEAVKLAIELGNDVNAVDRHGETAMHGAAYKQVPEAAQYLVDHGAKVELYNRKNDHGWTALRIAEGVHRGMNLRASPETAAVIRKAMLAAGVQPVVDPEENISGATK